MFRVSAKSVFALAFSMAVVASVSQTANAQFWQPNPVIGDSGQQITGLKYDPFSGRWVVRTDQRQIRESYLDQNRNYVDPGSYQRVDEYETDRNGVRWHVTGYRWTSNGTPHGNLNRRRISNLGPGVDIDENQNVVYSPGVTHDQNQSIGYSTGRGNLSTGRPTNSRLRTTPQVPNRSVQGMFNNVRSNTGTLRSSGIGSQGSTFPVIQNRTSGSGGIRIRSSR